MRWLKIGGVIFGALVITTLGISASDLLNGSSGSLLSQLSSNENSVCPADMVHVPTALSFTCVDRYEVSDEHKCPVAVPSSISETQENLNDVDCHGQSLPDSIPWTSITREQAQAVCMRSGKRLPTAAEWYFVAIGTPDKPDACNINGRSIKKTGSMSNCVSSTGVYDAVGNVWEWVSDDVFNATYADRPLPPEGYVTQVASDGVPTLTSKTEDDLFGKDYFWSNESGVYGMLRGGYFDSDEDAGVYTIQAKTAPTIATAAIGFRCVK